MIDSPFVWDGGRAAVRKGPPCMCLKLLAQTAPPRNPHTHTLKGRDRLKVKSVSGENPLPLLQYPALRKRRVRRRKNKKKYAVLPCIESSNILIGTYIIYLYYSHPKKNKNKNKKKKKIPY